jgi:AAA-like domain
MFDPPSAKRARIYTVGGAVQAGGGQYLTRSADDELLRLCRENTFAYVLAARQLGKSSLMFHTAERLKQEGVCPVIIDLTKIGAQVKPEQWYFGLLAEIEEQLPLSVDLAKWWREQSRFGFTHRLTKYFREVLLKEVAAPIVIFVDEVGATLGLDGADDFYIAVRYLYNARATMPELNRLSFALIGVATPGDLIRDPHRTPFNIGRRVELTDFTEEEAAPLAEGLNLPPDEAKQALRWAMKWTNGHPYLTQRLCLAMADERRRLWTEADVDRTVAATFFGAMSEQDNNLQFVHDMLTKRAPDLVGALTTYREIRTGKRPVRDEERSPVMSHLKLSGVVRREGDELRIRNRIYETVFDERWVKGHLPVNWRKRATYAAGGSIATLFILSLPTAIYSLNQSRKLAKALVETSNARKEEEARRKFAEQGAAEALSQKKFAEDAFREAESARRRAEASAQLARANAIDAGRLRDIAQSRELAANSISLLQIDPDLSLILATRAARIARTTQAEDALRRCLLESPMRDRVMSMPFDELMELARKLSPRELTPEERERYLHEPQGKRENRER